MDCICQLDWDMGIIIRSTQPVELCGDERKNTSDVLSKKGGFVYVVLVGYINFPCSTPSLSTKRSKEKNPTDPIMIVVRFSNRCELLTLEIHFLESV